MIADLAKLVQLIDEYILYLNDVGISFGENGFPILPKDAFLNEWPLDVVTYDNRRARYIRDKSRTLLCFYCADESIYRRLERVMEDIPEYRSFLGVVSTDVSVIRGMEKEWEDLLMLANQLFMAILSVNGVKVVLNTRSGSLESISNFSHLPKGIMCASGTLGCDNLATNVDYSYLSKILSIRPSKLVLYGKSDEVMEEQLATMGIDFRRFDDVHRAYKRSRPKM